MFIGNRAKRARHSSVCSIEIHDIYIYNTRKMVPITRRASLFLVFFCMYVNRKEEEEGGKNNRPINLPKVITFFADYNYTT